MKRGEYDVEFFRDEWLAIAVERDETFVRRIADEGYISFGGTIGGQEVLNGWRQQLGRLCRREPLPFLRDRDRNDFKLPPVDTLDNRSRRANGNFVFT